jgi:hypothetical protein
MTLQHHRPDGKGALELRPVEDRDWRNELRSPRWGSGLRNGRLPKLANTDMNPTSRAVSAAVWIGLAALTFVLVVLGYGTGFWG